MIKFIRQLIIYIDVLIDRLILEMSNLVQSFMDNYIIKKIIGYIAMNRIIILFIKIIGLYLYVNNSYNDLIVCKVLITMYIILIICILRIILKYILFKGGWDGNYPVKPLPKLRLYFRTNIYLNEVLLVFYKYFNLWYSLLIFRNGVFLILRYVRYFMYRMHVLKYWQRFEYVVYYVVKYILIEFIRILITDFYLPLKKRILFGDILNIFEWRVIILIIVLLFDKLPFIFGYYLLYKLISVLWRCMVYDFAKKSILSILGPIDQKCKLSSVIFTESYIFKNLKFHNISTYRRWIYMDNKSDNFYINDKNMVNDIYKGLWIKDVELLDLYFRLFSNIFVLFEYVAFDVNLKYLEKESVEALEEFVEIIELLKRGVNLINNSSKYQQIIYITILNASDFEIGLAYTKFSMDVVDNEISDNITYTKEISELFTELEKFFNKVYDEFEVIGSRWFDVYCELSDFRANEFISSDTTTKDKILYDEIFRKYNLKL